MNFYELFWIFCIFLNCFEKFWIFLNFFLIVFEKCWFFWFFSNFFEFFLIIFFNFFKFFLNFYELFWILCIFLNFFEKFWNFLNFFWIVFEMCWFVDLSVAFLASQFCCNSVGWPTVRQNLSTALRCGSWWYCFKRLSSL